MPRINLSDPHWWIFSVFDCHVDNLNTWLRSTSVVPWAAASIMCAKKSDRERHFLHLFIMLWTLVNIQLQTQKKWKTHGKTLAEGATLGSVHNSTWTQSPNKPNTIEMADFSVKALGAKCWLNLTKDALLFTNQLSCWPLWWCFSRLPNVLWKSLWHAVHGVPGERHHLCALCRELDPDVGPTLDLNHTWHSDLGLTPKKQERKFTAAWLSNIRKHFATLQVWGIQSFSKLGCASSNPGVQWTSVRSSQQFRPTLILGPR